MKKNQFAYILAFLIAFCLNAFAAPVQTISVTALWDANAETDIAGYKLYQGGSSRAYTNVVDVGNVTGHTISNLALAGTYYFAVTAYNTSGIESDFSAEVAYTAPGKPAPPSNFRIPASSQRVVTTAQISQSTAGPWEDWASFTMPQGYYARLRIDRVPYSLLE